MSSRTPSVRMPKNTDLFSRSLVISAEITKTLLKAGDLFGVTEDHTAEQQLAAELWNTIEEARIIAEHLCTIQMRE